MTIFESKLRLVNSKALNEASEKEYPNASKYVDPAMGLSTIAFLIVSSIPIMKKSSLILLQSLPEEMENVEVLCNDLKKRCPKASKPYMRFIFWCLVPNKVYATLHIVFTDEFHGYQYHLADKEFDNTTFNAVGDYDSKTEGKRRGTNESHENNGKETVISIVTYPLIQDEIVIYSMSNVMSYRKLLEKRCSSSISSLSNIGDEP